MDELKEKKQGLRYDPDTYHYVINALKRSQKYIKERGIFEKAEKYRLMYENEPQKAIGWWRKGNLSNMKIAIAFDAIETVLPVVTARAPMPDIKPEFSLENIQPILAMQQPIETQNTEQLPQQSQQPNPEDMQEQANQAFNELAKRATNYSKNIQKLLVKTWLDLKMQAISRMIFREKGKTSLGTIKSLYNPETKQIDVEICDITTLFPSPGINRIADHIDEPFIYRVVMSTEKVKRLYDVEDIKDSAIGDVDAFKVFEVKNDVGAIAALAANIKAWAEKLLPAKKNKGGHCCVVECYMPDYEEIEYEENEYQEDGSKKIVDGKEVTIQKTRKKYASGHKRVTIIEGHDGWVIEESENIYVRPPFYENRNYQQAGDFYGMSEIQMIEDLIMKINISAANVHDNLRLAGNPKLVVSRDAMQGNNETQTPLPITNEPGGIIYSENPVGVHWLEPPALGFDIWKWLEYLKAWADKILHITDAFRGYDESASDSGVKIQELRKAAAGFFGPKLDEHVEWIKDIFKQWAFIYQNLYDEQIVNKNEDEQGTSSFDVFTPAEGRDIKLNINVSGESIMPDDPWTRWETIKVLYSLFIPNTQIPLIPPEYVIDHAPELEDRMRIKQYIGEKEAEADRQTQLQQTMEQFAQLAEQASEVSETTPGTEQEDQLAQPLIQMVQQFPELMMTPEFQALPNRLKGAIVSAVAGLAQQQPTAQTGQVQ